MNARALNYTPAIDEHVLNEVEEHFTHIAKREGFPIGSPLEYDTSHFNHQVPGGMISNFRHQLSKLGMEQRLEEVLEETGRVRAEFGYPIMVTPYSQFVGVQAATNVILGERYKEVTDEVIQYAQGDWGEEESGSIDPNIKDKILNRSRAKELTKGISPSSINDLRQKLGGVSVSDDELLLRYFAGTADVDDMRRGRSPTEYASARHPLATLIGQLTKRKGFRQIHIERPHLTIRLRTSNTK
jgi:oxaloacetate decarboxylase alpha subunit